MTDYSISCADKYLNAGWGKKRTEFQKASKVSRNFCRISPNFIKRKRISRQQWSKAETLYQKSTRKLSRTAYHSRILWGLLVSQVQLKQGSKICRQAKELYMKYPSYSAIADWGIALNENSVNGTKVNCAVTFGEQSLRVQRLLWSGLEDKAFEEIQKLKEKTTERTRYDVDVLFVNYLIHVGHIDEAEATLAKYKSERAGDYDYLMILAKARARSSQPAKGIEAYYRAYQISPKTHTAAPALYHSAYLSYMVADYKEREVR